MPNNSATSDIAIHSISFILDVAFFGCAILFISVKSCKHRVTMHQTHVVTHTMPSIINVQSYNVSVQYYIQNIPTEYSKGLSSRVQAEVSVFIIATCSTTVPLEFHITVSCSPKLTNKLTLLQYHSLKPLITCVSKDELTPQID